MKTKKATSAAIFVASTLYAITMSLSQTVTNVTQDTNHQSIQDAINNASSGDTIQAGAGSYTEGPISLNKAVILRGPNAGLAGDDPARDEEARIVNSKITVTADATIDGFEIYQTDNTADAVLIQAAATVTNTVVRRDGVSTGTIARGVTTASGTVGYTISGNLFTGDTSGGLFGGHTTWNSGLWLNGGTGTVTGNAFENSRTAINLDDFNATIVLSGNTFSNCGTYLAFGGTTPATGQFTIAGNEFTVPSASALFNNSNVAASFRINATGNTWNGTASGDLTNDEKFMIEAQLFHRGRSGRNGVVDFTPGQQVVAFNTTTIQSAVNAAGSGDTVLVSPHDYIGDVNITVSGLTLQGSGAGLSTITGPVGGQAMTLKVSADDVTVDGFTITRAGNNPADWNLGGVKAAGGVHIQTVSNATITNNEIVGNRTGIDINNSSGHTIVGNSISNNRTGVILRNYTANLTVQNNDIIGNWTVGILFLDASGGSNSPIQEAPGSQFNNNSISGNWYGQVVDRQTGGSLPAPGDNPKDFTANWFGTDNPTTANVNSSEPGYADQIPVVFGGSAVPPAAPEPEILGEASANILFSPWYADEARTILVTAANFAPVTINDDDVVDDDLYIGGTTTVIGTLQINGELTLGPNGVLEVIDGTLILNDGSVLEGTFTFFNSLGSINFNDNVAITGSATGLILISDVHVANGATITVDGTLVIDGCVVDSDGRFDLVVGAGATFTMARTVFVNGDISAASDDTAIYDNRFENSTIEVTAAANGARVFHNLTDSLAWLTDGGTATVTVVDGWGNVVDAANTENNLALGLDIAHLPADRTQNPAGDVYIQPEDNVFATIDVSALQAKIAGVEVMLGYNTTLIDMATLGLEEDWNVLITSLEDDSNAIGLLDAAIGLSFDFADPAGSDADQTIGDVELEAGLTEGETLFFHRVKLETDTFGGETRLTTGGGSPSFLTPFTSNSAMITIDGTAPLIADPADHATIEQFGDDVNTDTEPLAVTIQGVIDITASAFDALAGIDDAKAVVTLVGPTTYTATQTGTSAGPNIGGDDYTTYTFAYTVDATSLNGVYDVVFTVTDRSGNQTVETLGSILINKNQVLVNVELEGLAAGPLTRDVVLVFTNSLGVVIETRTEAIEFTGGVGSVTLTDVDGDSFRLSAKTAWNLRKRLEVGFDLDGQSTVSFNGTNKLLGGDLNGDNVVNTLDYSILRFNWFTINAVADITGDGPVNATDYAILQANFYVAGDPQ